MATKERKQLDPKALAAKQASMAHMLASAKALHVEGRLRAVTLPDGVSRPAVRELRVKAA